MSTTTPDEGLIQAYLDDELSDEDRRELEDRFDADPQWAEAFRQMSGHADDLAAALAVLDEDPTSSTAPAWIAAISGRGARAAMEPGRVGASRPPGKTVPMARAAILVLVFGGALAAGLPGSPVREWLTSSSSPTAALDPAAESPAPAALATDPEEVGIRVAPNRGVLYVSVATLPEGGEVVVQLVEAEAAGVYGPNGTRFRTADGRVDVLNPDRVLRVELPRNVTDATITVGGQVYLRKIGDRIEVSGPVSDSTGTELRFRPSGG